MKCVVRIRNNEEVNVFLPQKFKAAELMKDLYEEECVRIDYDALNSYIEDNFAKVVAHGKVTEFYVRELVEVER